MPDDIAISTKDTPGTFDAVETAKPGEPIFTLQGGDDLAPATIHYWAGLAREKARGLEGEPRERLLRRASVAENVAWSMDEYRLGVPEVELARPAEEEPLDEAASESEAASDRRTRLIRGAEKLNGAVATIADIAEMIDEVGFADPSMSAQLAGFAALVRNAASMIEPRRGNERS